MEKTHPLRLGMLVQHTSSCFKPPQYPCMPMGEFGQKQSPDAHTGTSVNSKTVQVFSASWKPPVSKLLRSQGLNDRVVCMLAKLPWISARILRYHYVIF